MATSTPVLDLTTTAPQIAIDGDLYDLRVREDLSILTNTEHARRFARIEALRVKGVRTPKEDAEFATLLKKVCESVVDAPASVLDKLSQIQRLNVVTAFFQQIAIVNPIVNQTSDRKMSKPTSKK